MKRKNEVELSRGYKLFDNAKGSKTLLIERDVWIITHSLSPDLRPSSKEINELWKMRPEERGKIMMFGELVSIPRYNQTYGESGYNFSGVKNTALPITPLLQRYLDLANSLCHTALKEDYEGLQFNMIFLNWYENQTHYIGYHADDETQIYKNDRGETLVFSLSFGGERRFLLQSIVRDKDNKKKTHKFRVSDGTCLLMAGKCQSKYKHSVPKETKPCEKRVNFTFRILRNNKIFI